MQSKERDLPATTANAVPQTKSRTSHTLADTETSTGSHPPKSNKKRKRREARDEDEIDVLFSGAKKMKGVARIGEVIAPDIKAPASDLDANIINAIKSAPSITPRGKK